MATSAAEAVEQRYAAELDRWDSLEGRLRRLEERMLGVTKAREVHSRSLGQPLLGQGAAAAPGQGYAHGLGYIRKQNAPRTLQGVPAPPQRETFYGPAPATGPADFDMCFEFRRPFYAQHLQEHVDEKTQRRASKVAEEAMNDAEKETRKFAKMLMSRQMRQNQDLGLEPSRTKSVYDVDAKRAELLFKDFAIEGDDEVIVKGDIDSMDAARAACIDLLLSFFRRQEEPFYTMLFTSADGKHLFLCATMSEPVAERHADESSYPLQLSRESLTDPNRLNIKLTPTDEGDDGAAMGAAHVQYEKFHDPLLRTWPCEFDPNKTSILRKVDKIRLLYDRVTDILDPENMMKWNLMESMFPLHSMCAVEELRRDWARVGHWYRFDQPIEDVRNYFGENLALYFVFMGHLCSWMVWYAAFSLVITFVDLIADGGKHLKAGLGPTLRFLGCSEGIPESRFVCAIFSILWSLLFVVSLRRKIRVCYSLWGSDVGFVTAVKAQVNPTFREHAHMMPSQVDGNMLELDVDPVMRRRGRYCSVIGSVVFVGIAFACVWLILDMQAQLVTQKSHYAHYMSYVLAIQIKGFNMMWGTVCKYLTDRELIRDMVDYNNAIANKTYFVKLINTFCSFFYIAFAMVPLGDTSYRPYGTPWGYLTFQMTTTFGLYLFFTFIDVTYPIASSWWSRRQELKRLKNLGFVSQTESELQLHYIEEQAKMDVYAGTDMNEDYMQVLLPFAFILFFGTTLPVASCMALVVFGLQLRVDAWKLVWKVRRPYPNRTAPGQWIWQAIIESFMYLGALTNSGLVCFVLEPVASWKVERRFLLFFGCVLSVVVLHAILSYVRPETSNEVALAVRRHARQRELAAAWQKVMEQKAGLQGPTDNLLLQVHVDADFDHVLHLDGAGDANSLNFKKPLSKNLPTNP